MIDLDAAIQAALRGKDTVALAGYRAVKTKAAVKMAEPGRAEPGTQGEKKPLSEEEMLALIRREIKERKEANEYLKPGDAGHAANARIVELLEIHLPASLSPEEAEALIQKAMADVQPTGPKDMGKMMAALRKSGGPIEMGPASARVKALLAEMG